MGRQFKGKQLSNNLSLSGSFSGSFQGDGSKLTGVGAGGSSDVWYNGGTYATSSKNLIVTGSISVTPGTINYLTASYAISASHEIIKEVSSSYADTASYVAAGNIDGTVPSASSADAVAFVNITGKPTLVSGSSQIDLGSATGKAVLATTADTASYVNTLQQDVTITGSLNIVEAIEPIKITNGSNTMYMQVNNIAQLNSSRALRLKAQGDAFGTGVILESDTSNIEIKASSAGKKIFIHSPTIEITGSLTVTGSLNFQGPSNFESGSITFDVTTDPISPGSNTKVNIGAGSSTSVRALKIHTNEGYLEIGPQNVGYSHFYTDRANYYFNKPIHVNGAVYGYGGDLILGRNSGTEDTITLADEKVTIKLNDTDIFVISSSHEFSGSAASTASFGTYIGDGSQLTNVTGEWDGSHDGNASISGSLTLTGSLLNTGTVSINDTDSPYTLTGTQQFVLINPLGGDVIVNLPDAATYPGREIKFKLTENSNANTVTLQCQGADTIDGAASNTTDLEDIYEAISVVSNGGTGWFIF